jgi:hypothetical protein
VFWELKEKRRILLMLLFQSRQRPAAMLNIRLSIGAGRG